MPIMYHCDHCDTTAESLTGWLIVSVQLFHQDPDTPFSGGRTLDATLPELLFHEQSCFDAWRGSASLMVSERVPDRFRVPGDMKKL